MVVRSSVCIAPSRLIPTTVQPRSVSRRASPATGPRKAPHRPGRAVSGRSGPSLARRGPPRQPVGHTPAGPKDVVRARPERRRGLLRVGHAGENLDVFGERARHRHRQQRRRVAVDGDDQGGGVLNTGGCERLRLRDVADDVRVRRLAVVDSRDVDVRGQGIDRGAAPSPYPAMITSVCAEVRGVWTPDTSLALWFVDGVFRPGDDQHRIGREPVTGSGDSRSSPSNQPATSVRSGWFASGEFPTWTP